MVDEGLRLYEELTMKGKNYSIKVNIFSFTKEYYFLFHIRYAALGAAIIFIFQILVNNGSWVFLILIVLAVFCFFAKRIIQLNLLEFKVREAMSIFGLVIGTWKNTGLLEYLSIFPTKLAQRSGSAQTAMMSNFSMGKEHRLNLIHSKNRRLHLFTSTDLEEIKRISLLLGEKMNLGVYDCTGEENVWLRPRV